MATASLPGASMPDGSTPSAYMELPIPETTNFIYATKYDFLPLGVRKVKQVFEKKLVKENLQSAQCDYQRSEQSFFVTCATVEFDAVIDIFHKIISQILEEEVGYDDGYGDEIDSKLVARVHSDSDVEDVSGEFEEPAASGSEADETFQFWLQWKCRSENLIMDKIISRAAQVQIEELTGTKLFEDLNLQLIRIGSESEEAGELALHKLNVLRNSFDVAQRTTVHHVIYAEERENFQASIKQFVKIPKKLAQTTLLDPFRNQDSMVLYRKIHRLYTLRCCYFDPDRSTYLLKAGAQLFPLVQEIDKGIEFRPWKDYVYPKLGKKPPVILQNKPAIVDDDEEEILIPPLELKEKKENVKRWLADEALPDTVEQMDLLEAAEELKIREEKAKKWLADGASNILLTADENTSFDLLNLGDTLTKRHSMNNWTALNTAEKSALKKVDEESSYPLINLEESFPLNHPGSHPQGFQWSEPSSPRKATHRIILDDPDVWYDTPHPHIQSNIAAVSLNAVNDGDHTRDLTEMVSRDENWSQSLIDIGNMPQVQPGFGTVQLEKSNRKLPQDQVSHSVVDIQDRVQIVSEVDTRTYHSTMEQGAPRNDKDKGKAPAGKPNLNATSSTVAPKRAQVVVPQPAKPADPTEEFSGATKEKIKLLLGSMRLWQGDLVLEVQFGRIILRNMAKTLVAWGDSQISYPLEEIDWILSQHPQMQDFTRILTQIGADAQWVVDLKNDSNERMWKDVPKHSVTYEFECYDPKSPAWFMIEMNAATGLTKVKSLPKEIGMVWVHCTLRNWDYRLAATGSTSLEAGYGHIAAEIAKSISIVPGLKKMSMLFRLDEADSITLNFVRVLRTTLYPSTGNGSQLKITEVHDLKIENHSEQNSYYAFEAERLMEEGNPSKWYQISLTSPIAERVLKENVHLEFAEQTSWTEEVFDERVHVFDSLCRPAGYMVKKMDGMGFYNDNGYVAPPAGPSAASDVAPTVISRATAMDVLPLPPTDPGQW